MIPTPQTDQKEHGVAIWLGMMFVVLFFLNSITPYVADDWVYTLSFATRESIEHILDIVPSMYIHSSHMNGRIISHGIVQLFYIPPAVIFDLCNSLVFCMVLYISYRICTLRAKRNLLLLVAFSMGFWYLLPAFGQVCLWQIGSVNYLWALLFGLVYLCPFIRFYVCSDNLKWNVWKKIIFTVFSLLVGMYTEITSFIVLMLAVLLILSSVKRKSLRTWLWFPVFSAAAGYLILLRMPAEMQAKQSAMTFDILLSNFINASEMLLHNMFPILILWVLLVAVVRYRKGNIQKIWLSVLFAFGAISANYMLIVAAYYAERCMCTTTLFLLIACGILITDPVLANKRNRFGKAVPYGGFLILLLAFAVSFAVGSRDIWTTHTSFQERESRIAQYIANGITDVSLPCIQASTKYSAFYGIIDLNTEIRDTWPNSQMAKYYGLHSIIGQ